MSIASISGTVTVNGSPIAGAHITAAGGTNQFFTTLISNNDGNFTTGGIPDNITFILTPSLPGVTFTPAQYVVTTANGQAITGLDFAGVGTPSIGLLSTGEIVAKDFDIGARGDGLQNIADFINYHCSLNGNASLAGCKISSRSGVGSVQMTVLITESSRNFGLAATGDFYFRQFEILNDGGAAKKITDWISSFNTVIDANHYSVPSLVFVETYFHSNTVYLVIGLYRAVENSTAPQNFPPSYTVDIFKAEKGAADLQARLQAKPSNYYFSYDYAQYWTSWQSDTTGGSVIIGVEQ